MDDSEIATTKQSNKNKHFIKIGMGKTLKLGLKKKSTPKKKLSRGCPSMKVFFSFLADHLKEVGQGRKEKSWD